MKLDAMFDSLMQNGVEIGLKILGAIIIFIVGRWLIGLAKGLFGKALVRKKLDKTLMGYMTSALGVLLDIVLVVAILGFFGVETTTFAAVLAAAGVAIGMAWSGLLANFAAGVFLVVLRPFKAGDFVTIADVTGTVRDIGLFVTTIDTMDNVRTLLGNDKVFKSNIQNFSTNPYRRVDLKAQLAHGADQERAIAILKEALPKIPGVIESPAPDVEILDFNLAGPVLAVRPYTHTDNYWSVYFATNRAIRIELGKAGFPVPETHYQIMKPAA